MSNRKELAKEILDDAVRLREQWPSNVHPDLKLITQAGDEYPLFVANGPQPLGQIIYHYTPGSVVESVIAGCERLLNERAYFKKLPAEKRGELIKKLATSVTALVLRDLPKRLTDGLEAAFVESLFFAAALSESTTASSTGGVVDMRDEIEKLVRAAATKQRRRLAAGVNRAGRSEVITPEDDSRPPKITLSRLRLAYKAAKRGKDPGEKITQKEVAAKWKKYGSQVSTRQLRRWCVEELQLRDWDEVLDYLERT